MDFSRVEKFLYYTSIASVMLVSVIPGASLSNSTLTIPCRSRGPPKYASECANVRKIGLAEVG
jgi:hypothetical protein